MEEASESSSSAKPVSDESDSDESVDIADDDFVSGIVTTMEGTRGELPENANIAEPHVAESDVAEPDVAEPEVVEPHVAEPHVAESDVAEPDVDEPDENDSSGPPSPPLKSEPNSSTEEPNSARADRQQTQDFTVPRTDDRQVDHQPILLNGVPQPRPVESTRDEPPPINPKPANKRLGRPPSSAVQAARAAEEAKSAGPKDDALRPRSAAKLTSDTPARSPRSETAATKERELKPSGTRSKRRSQVVTVTRAAGYAAITFLALMGMAALGYVLAASDVLG